MLGATGFIGHRLQRAVEQVELEVLHVLVRHDLGAGENVDPAVAVKLALHAGYAHLRGAVADEVGLTCGMDPKLRSVFVSFFLTIPLVPSDRV